MIKIIVSGIRNFDFGSFGIRMAVVMYVYMCMCRVCVCIKIRQR